jgi:carbon-monoxide dehydrogenase small subunit
VTDFLTDSAVAVTLTVNGAAHDLQVEPRELLVSVLRDRLGLTGTHIGCETTSCGACTVLLDGRSVKSCTMLALQAQGHAVTTIEGLAGTWTPAARYDRSAIALASGGTGGRPPGGQLHPVQEAFRSCHGLQCGFCTPGMVMAAVSLIDEGRAADEHSVRSALEGNLCRCTGYHNIVQAVLSAARAMQGGGS